MKITCMCDNLELQKKHELKMQALREELELRRKTEVHEIEEVSTRGNITGYIRVDVLHCSARMVKSIP